MSVACSDIIHVILAAENCKKLGYSRQLKLPATSLQQRDWSWLVKSQKLAELAWEEVKPGPLKGVLILAISLNP